MKHRILALALLGLPLGATPGVGCAKTEPPLLVPEPAPRGAPASAARPANPTTTVVLPAAARAALDKALAAYESMRKQLAHDTTGTLASDAATLADAEAAAEAALGADAAAAKGALDDLAAAARSTAPADLAAARTWFGSVSKALIAITGVVPSLREGRHIFSCPMTKDYPKWIQTDAKLENPLQGQAMPTCGEAASWTD
ncbi:MAG: hypothetical protein U1F43_09915 [Myxococcota bacterium]